MSEFSQQVRAEPPLTVFYSDTFGLIAISNGKDRIEMDVVSAAKIIRFLMPHFGMVEARDPSEPRP